MHDLVANYRDNRDTFPELHGDFSLNAANAVSFDSYRQMGLARIAPTHDLNAKQIEDLAVSAGPESIELIAFHHLPVFHTEHCVFCRFLSNGTDNTNCGHPCEKHAVSLEDSHGRRHPVLADVGCRNTVFGAEAQSASKHLSNWLKAGFCHFRIEFVHQDEKQVTGITNAFRDYFEKRTAPAQLEDHLRSFAAQGVTEGSLFVPKNFKQLVQLS